MQLSSGTQSKAGRKEFDNNVQIQKKRRSRKCSIEWWARFLCYQDHIFIVFICIKLPFYKITQTKVIIFNKN